MTFCLKKSFKPFKANIFSSIFRYSTVPEVIEDAHSDLYEKDLQIKEAKIEKRRNKSGLSSAHFNVINNRVPYEEPRSLAHLTVKYNRKMYGKYGIVSGVNPSLCWPSKSDIQEIKEYELVAHPFTIQEMVEQAQQKRKEEKEKMINRDNEVAAKYAKLEQWKKELNDKLTKKTMEAEAAKNKKERLVEEVRRHFGFKLDPKDERFQEMLEKREKEQKRLEKMARREAKEKLMITKLQQQNADVNNSTN